MLGTTGRTTRSSLDKRDRLGEDRRSVDRHPFIAWLFKLRGSPRAIGGGVAIGIFVALTPTIGVQTAIAVCLATVLNANRPAAAVAVWVTNPATAAPIYALTYAVGKLFWPTQTPSAYVIERLGDTTHGGGLLDLGQRLETLLAAGSGVLMPLWIGGALLGLIVALVGYAVTVRLVANHRRKRGLRGRHRLAARHRQGAAYAASAGTHGPSGTAR